MRLSDFIREHADEILATWDEFAATVAHSGEAMDQKALRDHAGQILLAIAADLEQPQSAAQQIAKSRGEASRDARPTTPRPKPMLTLASRRDSRSTPC